MIPERVMGLETEFGLTCASTRGGAPPLDAEEAATELFRPLIDAGHYTNTFLPNGARLYLDVGSHPEYATAECRTVADVVAQDRAGEMLYADMAASANERLAAQGVPGRIHLFKNNLDAKGNSYGCHENYLVRRRSDYRSRIAGLLPFFVTRQIVAGAGYVRRDEDGTVSFAFSQRADQTWDTISSASTRSRPMVNTRDEPHGDPELYRRMHVIVGDSNVAEPTTALKLGITQMLLVMIEDGAILPNMRLADPIAAIRATSLDLTGRARLELVDGGHIAAIDVQRRMCEALTRHFDSRGYTPELSDRSRYLIDLWQRAIDAVETGEYSSIATEIDWAAKLGLIERYVQRTGASLDDPRVARLDLAYHDITDSGLRNAMEAGGLLSTFSGSEAATRAMVEPPQDTRAKLRGAFIEAAQRQRVDYSADWMNLRLLEAAGQRSVVLKDPFATADERVDALIEGMSS
ncbi:MAG: Pup--protein ligase [Actinomycetaceae bacterium]|nr:Pup--protein ligase [Actinomycetaceae bacterium]